jgi:outer membrane immunogenic protein
MKKLLLGSVALVALGVGAPAIAADMGVRPRAVAYVAASNWTGCHVGGSVGNEWGRSSDYSTTGQSSHSVKVVVAPIAIPAGQQVAPGFDMNGFNGGFYAGCDYQAGAWVFGIEGDWSNVNKEGQAFDSFTFDARGLTVTSPLDVNSAQERWFATVRGRLGYAVDKWLFYVTGGVAWARITSAEWLITQPVQADLQTDTRTGWTVGVGLEYALGWGWSVRSEYLYIDIPSYTTFTPGIGAGLATNLNTSSPTFLSTKLNNNIWRFGLTYKFGNYAVAAAVTK